MNVKYEEDMLYSCMREIFKSINQEIITNDK